MPVRAGKRPVSHRFKVSQLPMPANDFLSKIRTQAYKTILIQIVLITIVAVLCLIFYGIKEFWSALVGGAAWLVPSLYFVRKFFIMDSKNLTQHIWKNFYLGELLKLVSSAILVVISIKWLNVLLLPFIYGYLIAVMSIWLMPIFLLKRHC